MMTSDELEALYRRYFPMVHAKCRRVIRDDAEAQDLAQEAFTKLWLHRASLRETDAALGWLYRTVTRLAVDRLRRRAPVVRPIDEAAAPFDPRDQVLAKDLVARAAARIPPDELQVLILSRVDRLTHVEVASVMQISERTVRRLLRRAQDRLARFEEKAS